MQQVGSATARLIENAVQILTVAFSAHTALYVQLHLASISSSTLAP